MAVEHTFTNWLKGYSVYMSLVAATYPERGWHLANHLGNVLKAQCLAGDTLVMQYDIEFGKLASHNELARWDLLHKKIWVVKVGPYAKPSGDSNTRKTPLRRDAACRVCWEFNQGRCFRTHCKFEPLCKACLESHSKQACKRSSGAQHPFQGFHPLGSGKREGGAATAGHTTTSESLRACTLI